MYSEILDSVVHFYIPELGGSLYTAFNCLYLYRFIFSRAFLRNIVQYDCCIF